MKKLSIKEMKTMMIGRELEFISYKGFSGSNTRKHQPCPCSDSKDALRIRVDGSFYCNKGQSGDYLNFLQHAYGYTFKELFDDLSYFLGVDEKTKADINKAKRKSLEIQKRNEAKAKLKHEQHCFNLDINHLFDSLSITLQDKDDSCGILDSEKYLSGEIIRELIARYGYQFKQEEIKKVMKQVILSLPPTREAKREFMKIIGKNIAPIAEDSGYEIVIRRKKYPSVPAKNLIRYQTYMGEIVKHPDFNGERDKCKGTINFIIGSKITKTLGMEDFFKYNTDLFMAEFKQNKVAIFWYWLKMFDFRKMDEDKQDEFLKSMIILAKQKYNINLTGDRGQ